MGCGSRKPCARMHAKAISECNSARSPRPILRSQSAALRSSIELLCIAGASTTFVLIKASELGRQQLGRPQGSVRRPRDSHPPHVANTRQATRRAGQTCDRKHALPRGLRRPSEFNHLAKSGTPNRSTQSLGFLAPVSHLGTARNGQRSAACQGFALDQRQKDTPHARLNKIRDVGLTPKTDMPGDDVMSVCANSCPQR